MEETRCQKKSKNVACGSENVVACAVNFNSLRLKWLSYLIMYSIRWETVDFGAHWCCTSILFTADISVATARLRLARLGF
jgi:hypothetical protein